MGLIQCCIRLFVLMWEEEVWYFVVGGVGVQDWDV